MYNVFVDYAPTEADNAVVREGIIAFNENIVGERDKAFSIFLKNDLAKVFGGIQAFLGTESVYIEVLWVTGNLQKQGYGTKLLDAAEREAIKNGCIFSLVDTWDFQAEEFYLKNGYERIGEIKDYWLGHSKIFLRKNLREHLEHDMLKVGVKAMNKETIKRYFDAYNSGDYKKTVTEFYADDAIFESTRMKYVGKKEIINAMEKSHKMVDEKLIPLNILVDGDKMAVEFEVEFNALQDNPDSHHKQINVLKKGEIFKIKIAAFYNMVNNKIQHVKVYYF
jgi:GNAT superfamily N-acetyltransferase/ketosteroid isomerase-like protein